MTRPVTITRMAASLLLLVATFPGAATADGGDAHQLRQPRPIQLGASGGSADDRDGAFCCGGTLGGLVEDAQGRPYLLSNNHVLGRTNRAIPGEDTVQPGLIDSACRASSDDIVADFTEMIPIDFESENRVDAAIARVRDNAVDSNGTLIDIGTPATEIIVPIVGMAVQKSGRTTGHTTGTIVATDVTVLVAYPKKCGGGSGPAALMVDQFRIDDGSFSAGGDSGAIILENSSNPRAVGLLFAGSSTSTVANSMHNVLGAAWSVGPLGMAGGSISGCESDAACDDADPCTVDICLASGVCEHAPISCDDGNACTEDQCVDGTCPHGPVACDDGDPCTEDVCLVESGCDFQPLEGCVNPCGDGVCDIGAGEDCQTCAEDCNGQLRGRRHDRFCCGLDVGCGDPRCGDVGTCAQQASWSPTADVSATPEYARAAKRRASDRLLSLPDVVGHGIGRDSDGMPVIEIYLSRRNASARAAVPDNIEGVPVRAIVTGPFIAN